MTIRVPQAGLVVYLDGAASPQFRDHPIQLSLTSPAQPSSVDAAAGRVADRAVWWLLTGWQLDPRGRRLLHRTVSARAIGVQIIDGSVVA